MAQPQARMIGAATAYLRQRPQGSPIILNGMARAKVAISHIKASSNGVIFMVVRWFIVR